MIVTLHGVAKAQIRIGGGMRDPTVSVRISAEARDWLAEEARNRGVSRSSFLRALVEDARKGGLAGLDALVATETLIETRKKLRTIVESLGMFENGYGELLEEALGEAVEIKEGRASAARTSRRRQGHKEGR